jgi:Xaa-Pro aminopeptidase
MGEAMSLCVSCKGCKRECPTGVDMARMKIEVQHARGQKHGFSLRERLVAALPRYAPIAARLPWLANLRNRVPALARLMETATGFAAAMKGMRAGMNEFDLQEAVEHAYRTNGARELAFRTIAGGGFNATVLHYHANDQVLQDGELVVLDSGAKHAGYSADVTRTLPVSGKFTPRQRELYDIVLRAQAAAIAAIKPGVTLAQVDAAGRKVITDAGLGDAFIHGMGHHLGLETHDASPDAPLEVGAVITVEPGVYLPKESIGIRIEDDVAVTDSGHEVLTPNIPRTADEVERAMAR